MIHRRKVRSTLVNSLAYELTQMKDQDLNVAYAWFKDQIEKHKLNSSEQFSLVFLAGGLANKEEK